MTTTDKTTFNLTPGLVIGKKVEATTSGSRAAPWVFASLGILALGALGSYYVIRKSRKK